MSQFSFGNIILASNGKKGLLKPIDDSGYYLLNAGGFNVPNRNGIKYTANQYIQECMSEDSDLMRRIKRGEVYGECGHPPMFFYERVNGVIVRTKITDLYQWIMRLKTIDMDRAAFHIRNIHFDTDAWTPNNNGPIYNSIEVKPYLSTVFGKMFEENLLTPDMNTSVSIRTVTAPQQFGHNTREVEYFTGYDWVYEAGMDWANKHMTAGCEAFLQEMVFDEKQSMTLDTDTAIQLIEAGLEKVDDIRSVEGVEAFESIKGLLGSLKRHNEDRKQKHTISYASNCLDLF